MLEHILDNLKSVLKNSKIIFSFTRSRSRLGWKIPGAGAFTEQDGSETLVLAVCSYSFLCGDPGPLALAAVLAYRNGDRKECSKLIKALVDLSTIVRLAPTAWGLNWNAKPDIKRLKTI